MPDEAAPRRWQVHGRRGVYSNRWVDLSQWEVTAPDGSRWWHHVVELLPVSIAIVLDAEDRVLMLQRHRFVTGTVCWELPGGVIEAGEDGAKTAAREAEEETGWRPAGPGQNLCTFQPMPGMVDARHEVYLFFGGAIDAGPPTDEEEAGPVRWVPLAEVPGMVSRAELSGAGSLVGLLQLLALRDTEC